MTFSFTLSFLLSFTGVVDSQRDAVVLTDSVTILSPSVQVYSELGSDEFSEVELPPDEAFKSIGNEVPNLGLSPGRHWFRVRLKNALESQRFIVEAGYPLLDYVDFFVKKSHGVSEPVLSGDLRPFSKRERLHRTLNFGVFLAQGETADLYFRVETQSSVQLPLTVYTEAAFAEHAATENIGFGLFYGSFLVIILFNLFQWLMIRESIYGKYVGFLVCLLLFQMAINGSLFQWVFPASPSVANTGLLVFNFMAWGFAFLFGASFVSLNEISPRFNQLVTMIASACALGALVSFILPYRSLVAFVVIFGLFFPPIFGAMGIAGIRAGQRSAKYFTLAFAILLLGSILYALKTATILPANFVTEYAVQLGAVAQIVLLSLALGDQAREVFEQRDSLWAEVLEKTNALTEEATKRSELERQRAQAVEDLKLEAETKVALFSDATHHLNNPLNHITGAREIIGSEVGLIRERLDSILPDDDDPDVKEVRKAFRLNFEKIAESEMRLDDALSRASNAVSVLRAVSGVDGIGVEPCYLAEIWALLKERTFIVQEDSSLSPPANLMEVRVLGAPGLYVQAMELLLEESQSIPTVTYIRSDLNLICRFENCDIHDEKLDPLLSKINHLIRPTGAKADIAERAIVELSLPRMTSQGSDAAEVQDLEA